MFSSIFSLFYIYMDSIAFLLLSAIGLIIIMGMMGITNLAHGELMMIGAYVTVSANRRGLPLPLAMLAAALTTAVFGLLIEKVVIKRFYGNLLQSLVATWGISIIISQVFLVLFGPSLPGIKMPLGGFRVGEEVYSVYRIVIALISLLALFFIWWLFRYTRFGRQARATMQNPEIAEALGVNVNRIYLIIFGIGSGLAGLAGAVYAPTTVIGPTYGQGFMAPAFVTVIVSGGADVISGAFFTSLLLGVTEGSFSIMFGTFTGKLALLLSTMVILRFLPEGISGFLTKKRRSL